MHPCSGGRDRGKGADVGQLLGMSTGAFTERTLDGQMLGDMTSSYAAAAFTLSGHLDF
jgi:hypothetical protein